MRISDSTAVRLGEVPPRKLGRRERRRAEQSDNTTIIEVTR
jgi:hypothetical protein